MAQDNWWEAAPVVERQPASTPGFIPGRPKQPSQLEMARESRAIEDQALQREANDRANAAAMRAADAATRQAQIDERKLTQEAKLTEGESKATNFYNSALGAEQEWNRLLSDPQTRGGTEPAGVMGDAARAVLPSGLVNSFTSAERQQAEQAKLNFIRASLRLESGAAIGQEEYARQERTFFPQAGDSPETIAQKARARQQIIEGFRIGAGAGAGKVDTLRGDASPVPTERQSLSISSLTDLATGLSGGDYTPTPDGGLTYNGEPVSASAEVLNSDQYREAYKAKFGEYPPVQVDVSGGGEAPPDPRMAGRENAVLDPFIRGAADTLTLGGADEISAAAQTIFGGGTMRDNLRRERAIDAYDGQNNPIPRIAGQVAGGFGLPTGGANSAGSLAGIGAGYAAAYGFGSSDGSFSDRLLNAGLSAPVGAAGGYLGGRVSQYLNGRVPPPGPQRGSDIAQAAYDQGVDLMPADVGGPLTRRLTSVAAQLPASAGSVVRAGQRVIDQSAGVRDRAAGMAGTALDPVAAGERAAQGAASFITRTRARGGNLYDEAAQLAGDARVDPTQARQVLSQQIQRLEQVPGGGAGLDEAKQLLGNLEGNFTVQGIRDMRTEMFVKPELRGTPASARLRQIVDAAADDVATSLEAQGKQDAAEAFRRADRYWRQRIETIDQTLAPIIGSADRPKSGEQVYQALMTATRKDSAQLGRFMQSLPADEQAAVRATVIAQLGRASAGGQGAEGNTFSLNQFLTQWNQMTPRARDVLFRGEARDALNDLAKIAEGSKQAASYANRSNTGGVMGGLATGGSVAIDLPTFGGTVAAQFLTGKLLASPRFARFLARPPANREAALRRLNELASREPSIAADVSRFAQAQFAASPGRAAASDQQNGGRPEVPQNRRP